MLQLAWAYASQPTRNFAPILFQCCDVGPTLKQHWVKFLYYVYWVGSMHRQRCVYTLNQHRTTFNVSVTYRIGRMSYNRLPDIPV